MYVLLACLHIYTLHAGSVNIFSVGSNFSQVLQLYM